MGKKKPLEEFLTENKFLTNQAPISPIVETHFHLDMIKQESKNVLSGYQKLGVSKAITISTSFKNWEKVITFSDELKSLGFTLGTHPHEADSFDKNDFYRVLKNHRQNKKLQAIGEIGLDYFYNLSSTKNQIDCFEYHLDLASKEDLPVVIHNRESDEDMIHSLKKYSSEMKQKGVIHSFSSGIKLAEYALENDFYLGFNGMCTFKSAENVREAIRLCPMHRILLETDSPFLTPTPYRGKENTPSYLPVVAIEIAKIKNISLKDCLDQIHRNSHHCFKNLENIQPTLS